jgi:hypothetical protein
MSLLHFLDLTLHKTTPQYRAGLLNILEYAKTILQTILVSKSLVPKDSAFFIPLNAHVHELENESSSADSEQYHRGIYAAVGWFQHALHPIQVLTNLHINEICEHIQTIVCDIDKLST